MTSVTRSAAFGPARVTGPEPIPSGGLSRRGLSPVRATLDNGVVVLAKETHTTPAVTISLAVRAGLVGDPPDASGAMSLLSRVIDRGTATRSAAAIAEDLDNRGISLALTVTRQLFSIVCTCLADDFDAVLELVGDIVTSPSRKGSPPWG